MIPRLIGLALIFLVVEILSVNANKQRQIHHKPVKHSCKTKPYRFLINQEAFESSRGHHDDLPEHFLLLNLKDSPKNYMDLPQSNKQSSRNIDAPVKMLRGQNTSSKSSIKSLKAIRPLTKPYHHNVEKGLENLLILSEQCKGVNQNPVNIDRTKLTYEAKLKPFKFINYEQDVLWNVAQNEFNSKF